MQPSIPSLQQHYDLHPYPGTQSQTAWQYAPLEWWNAVARPGQTKLQNGRILIAGCGTGQEAFHFAHEFPDCEVIGVDFSQRSIEIARQQAGNNSQIQFITADLTSTDFVQKIGGAFDLISCHGVLSYVGNPVSALANLRQSLAPGASLYIGVNGADHFSERVRMVFPAMGVDPEKFEKPEHIRSLIRFCEEVADVLPRASRAADAELAGEFFGAGIHNLPLWEWMSAIEQAGLHVRGVLNTAIKINRVREEIGLYLLLAREPNVIHTIVDALSPAKFHTLILSAELPVHPPFSPEKIEKFKQWKPLVELWNRLQIPENPAESVTVSIDIPGLFKDLKLELSPARARFLRECDGSRTLGEIFQATAPEENLEDWLLDLARLHASALVQFRE